MVRESPFTLIKNHAEANLENEALCKSRQKTSEADQGLSINVDSLD